MSSRSRLSKPSMGNGQKAAKFIAPGKLAEHGYVKRFKGSEGIALASKSTHGVSAHYLILHYGSAIFEERDFTEESSFLDILKMCKHFIDIYSVGFKITHGDGRPLRNDTDVLNMFREHEDVENINLYLAIDKTAQRVLFKLPEDNPSCVSPSTSRG